MAIAPNYVHLGRGNLSVARSYRQRYSIWMMKAYREDILLNLPPLRSVFGLLPYGE